MHFFHHSLFGLKKFLFPTSPLHSIVSLLLLSLNYCDVTSFRVSTYISLSKFFCWPWNSLLHIQFPAYFLPELYNFVFHTKEILVDFLYLLLILLLFKVTTFYIAAGIFWILKESHQQGRISQTSQALGILEFWYAQPLSTKSDNKLAPALLSVFISALFFIAFQSQVWFAALSTALNISTSVLTFHADLYIPIFSVSLSI